MSLPGSRPLLPMGSRPDASLQRGGDWDERKNDGFRAIVYRDERRSEIDSRNGKPLAPYFRELFESLQDALPDRCVEEEEIVAWGSDGIDFEPGGHQ